MALLTQKQKDEAIANFQFEGILIEEGAFEDYRSFKEKQYDKLADTLRAYLNMEEIYGMLREARLE